MIKNYLLIPGLLTVFISITAFTFQQIDKGQPDFQNLKVLPKNISEESLDSIMRNFSVSLDVHCNFCHAASADTSKGRHLDFASDAKDEKNTARKMYEMTAYLNVNYFNWDNSTRPDTIHAVICYTCHRGSKEPDASVFLAVIDSTIQAHRKKK